MIGRRPAASPRLPETGPGACQDNALAESFLATYELEAIEPATWPTGARAWAATLHRLEAIYNRRRRHSALDMLGPVDVREEGAGRELDLGRVVRLVLVVRVAMSGQHTP